MKAAKRQGSRAFVESCSVDGADLRPRALALAVRFEELAAALSPHQELFGDELADTPIHRHQDRVSAHIRDEAAGIKASFPPDLESEWAAVRQSLVERGIAPQSALSAPNRWLLPDLRIQASNLRQWAAQLPGDDSTEV